MQSTLIARDVNSHPDMPQNRWNADHEAVNSNLAWYLSVYLSSAEFLVYAAVVVFASFVVVGPALAVASAAAALFFLQFR